MNEDGTVKDESPLEVVATRCIGCESLAGAQRQAVEERRYIWNWRLPKRS